MTVSQPERPSTAAAGAGAARLRAMTHGELSTAARWGHVALLLISVAMGGAVASLWLTEPGLPPRTHVAFAILVFIATAWTSYATWVLTSRRVLLARHRVVAGWMATTFSGVSVAAALVAVAVTGAPAAYAAAGFSVVMLAVAVALLVRAQRSFGRLAARRADLERQLAQHR